MKGRIIGIVVAFALLAALVYVSDASKVVEVLIAVNPYYIALALGIVAINGIMRTVRWRYLLLKVGVSVNFIDAMKVLVTGIGISNLTPGKSGEPIRSVLLKKVTGNRVSVTLPSILIERALDVAAMIIISAIGLLMLTSVSEIINWFLIAILFYVVIFVAAAAILSSEKRTKWAVKTLFRALSFIPRIKKFGSRMDEFASDTHKSFMLYNKKGVFLIASLYSLLIWLFEGVVLWISFASLGLIVSPIAAVTIISAGTLIAVLTFLPGGLGSGEIITVVFFTALFSLTMAEVTATALLARFLGFWIYVGVGAIFLATMRYRYRV